MTGQRLSACTCPGEHHPGPVNADGTFVGRSAPEIDVLEAIVNNGVGQVSQSAQSVKNTIVQDATTYSIHG